MPISLSSGPLTLLLAMCLSWGQTSAQPSDSAIIFVDGTATGANNGTSWNDAYTNLQSALGGAGAGQQIWVAKGTYSPGNARTSTFALVPKVGLFGGFAGTETGLDQRNWSSNPTYLSGVQSGPGVYHVVTSTGGTKDTSLDGFLVHGGDADNSATTPKGGGLLINGGALSVRNTIFFSNAADGNGGAVAASGATVTFNYCGFLYNLSAGQGGAVDDEFSDLSFARCYFGDNAAFRGGAINSANSSGLRLENSILFRNSATDSGGGIEADFSSPNLINCTLVENSSGSQGGGLYLYTGVQLTMTNCILWDNSDPSGMTEGAQVSKSGDPSTTITANHCCIRSLVSPWGLNNITANPLFVNQSGGDLHLSPCSADPCSPCIDTGTNSVWPHPRAIDFDGHRRIQDGNGDGSAIVDMGAYEASL